MQAIRKLFSSKFGAALGLLFVIIIGAAFAAGDISGLSSGGGQSGGMDATVVKVGKQSLTEGEVRQRVQQAYERAREGQPGLDLATFINGGGFDQVLDQLTNTLALNEYGKQQGFGVSKRLVDGRIADMEAFQGVDGKFSQQRFNELLRARGISEKELRADIERELLISQMVTPAGAAARAPLSFAQPYATMMLEKRSALAAFIPSQAYAGSAAPTDAALTSYIKANAARYRVPEQRAIRYAIFDAEKAPAQPATEEQIAQFYKQNAARFQARESRTFNQVITRDEAQAKALAAKVQAGEKLTAAASGAGLAASPLKMNDQAALAAATNADIAKQGYAAATGALIGPVKVPLGFALLQVDQIEKTEAKTLAEARPEIEKTLAATQANNAIRDFYNKLQDELEGGANAAEVAKRHQLTVETTPLVVTGGRSLTDPAFRPLPDLEPIYQAGFQAPAANKGTVVQLPQNRYAIVDAAQVVAAAVPPLAEIKTRVAADWQRSEGAKKAREAARAVADAMKGSTSLADAVKTAGAKAQPVQRIAGQRAQAASPDTPKEVSMLFSMAPKTTKTLELPNDAGWMVLYLDEVTPATQADPKLVQAVQDQLSRTLGNEYVAQMLGAAQRALGIKRNEATITRLKQEMLGNTQ